MDTGIEISGDIPESKIEKIEKKLNTNMKLNPLWKCPWKENPQRRNQWRVGLQKVLEKADLGFQIPTVESSKSPLLLPATCEAIGEAGPTVEEDTGPCWGPWQTKLIPIQVDTRAGISLSRPPPLLPTLTWPEVATTMLKQKQPQVTQTSLNIKTEKPPKPTEDKSP